MIPHGSLVVYVTPRGRRYIKKLQPGADWHSNDGVLAANVVAQACYGDVIPTSLNVPIRLEEATLEDRIMGIKRKTQIIYPKDIAWLCMKLGAGSGRTIIEAGCGSGAMTLALSWFCGPTGKVISHDERPEFVELARRNLEWAGIGQNVEFYCRDIADGFAGENADALFLDVREPWLFLDQALRAVRSGATLAFLLPTINQVSRLLLEMENKPVGEIDICEVLIRNWKPLPDRIRPRDRMTAHTGFLVSCRQQAQSPEFDWHMPRGTRERKQDQALAERNAHREDNPGGG